MADPRGLSGAVFQQTPVRDFTKDLLLKEQLGAEEAKLNQESNEAFLDEYDVDMPTEIPSTYQPSYLKLLDQYKNEAGIMGQLRVSDPSEYRKRLPAFKNFKNGLIFSANASKEKFAFAEADARMANKHRGKFGEEGFLEIAEYAKDAFNPTSEFSRGEDGIVMFGNEPASEGLRAKRFYLPKEEPLTVMEMVKKRGVDPQDWAKNLDDGSSVLDNSVVNEFFGVEVGRNSPVYKQSLREAIKIKTQQDVSDEEAAIMLENRPEYLQEAKAAFLKDAGFAFKKRGPRADSEGAEFNFGNSGSVSKLKGTPVSDYSSPTLPASNVGVITFKPRDINIDTIIDRETKTGEKINTPEISSIKSMTNIDGEIYVEISYLEAAGESNTAKIKSVKLNNTQKAQIEEQLGIPPRSLLNYFDAKTTLLGNKTEDKVVTKEKEESEQTDLGF